MTRTRWALVAIGVAAVAWLLWPRRPPSDEEQIRALLADAAEQASHKQLSNLMEHVSERYQGEAGGKAELKQYLAAYLFRSDWVEAVERGVEVKVEGDKATARLVVLLVRAHTPGDQAVPPELVAGTHRLELELAREDRWRITAASRQEVGPGEFLRP